MYYDDTLLWGMQGGQNRRLSTKAQFPHWKDLFSTYSINARQSDYAGTGMTVIIAIVKSSRTDVIAIIFIFGPPFQRQPPVIRSRDSNAVGLFVSLHKHDNWLPREQCFSLLYLAPQLCVYKDL